jgi:mannose-6-phosphate isomerase-like protein (cupin superfamily)
MSTRTNQSCNSFLEDLPKGVYPDSAIPLENALSSMDNSFFCYQSLMPVQNSADSPVVCDARDMAIAVLEGEGRLFLQGEEVPLKAGKFVFIPAKTPHRLQSTSNLILFLSSYESNPSTEDTAWVFDL